MDEFEKWLDSQPILLQKNLSERDEAMKRDAFTAGRKSGYEAGLRRAAEVAKRGDITGWVMDGGIRDAFADAILAEIGKEK